MADPKRTGEFDFIARHFAPLAAGEPGALGLTDDAAVLPVSPGGQVVVTTDALVAGVHFLTDDPPDSIAWKLLGVNLSDLAAMGAVARSYTVAVMLPADLDDAWVAAFARGLGEAQARYGVTLVGGDTVGTPGPLSLSLTALGEVEAGRGVRRSGARDGDVIYVSGTIGDAALGLKVLRAELTGLDEDNRAFLIDRYRRPRPRVALGPGLPGLAHAAIDISDGLVADLGHICETSGLGAEVNAAAVPLSPATRAALAHDGALLPTVLGGGDDYEILFTAPAGREREVNALSDRLDLALTPIGRMTTGSTVRVVDASGDEMEMATAGFRHF